MTILQSAWATQQRTTPAAGCKGSVVAQLFEFTMPAATVQANDIIELAVLPPGHVPVDATLVPDDLDTGAGLVFDVGLMSGDVGDKVSARTCGNELFAASTAGQAGTVTRMSAKSGFTIEPSDKERSIGVKVTTAALGQVAGAKLRLLLSYRPA